MPTNNGRHLVKVIFSKIIIVLENNIVGMTTVSSDFLEDVTDIITH
jgi:hypothetical protein